jgi:predicted amidophosphoribosyltransferase
MWPDLHDISQNIYNWFHEQVRCCLHCGSFQSNRSQFCRVCEKVMWEAHPQNHRFTMEKSKITGTALFEWHPDQDRRISKLMINLKGGRLQGAFGVYAERFVSRMKGIDLQETILVPCPAKGDRKHSQVLAQAFSSLLGLPVYDVLENGSQSPQKGRLKRDRERILLTAKVQFPDKHVIFIDDIVTTGATAQAAANALKPNRGFEVWCLAHRRQLATDLGLCYNYRTYLKN